MNKKELICPVERIVKFNAKVEFKSTNDKINIKTDLTFKNPIVSLIEWTNKKIKENN